MNTKVKIGIAAVIVAALGALIILDQKTSKKNAPKADAKDTASNAKKDTGFFTFKREDSSHESEDPGRKLPVKESDLPKKLDELSKKHQTTVNNPDPRDTSNKTDKASDGSTDEYVIERGDTYASIAEKRFGNASYWKVIADANPDMKPTAMKVGKKIKIPAKPDAKTETAKVEENNGKKVYTVQPGDTLGAISQKTYNTSRFADKIYQANRETLASPDVLEPGMKLTLPEIAPAKATMTTEPNNNGSTTEDALAGKKSHKVSTGDKLWNIAEKYRGQRGIYEMIDMIVKANPDKLQSASTTLRIGWTLVIPE